MAISTLELVLIAFFSSVQTETNGLIRPLPVELHATIDLPCRCPICPESTALVQWYRSSNPNDFIQDSRALAWWSEGTTGSSQAFGITDDFSMTIYSVNLTDQHDQEFYRCIVTPLGGAAECTHDVKLEIFAKPESSPAIKYTRLNNGFNVTCSISNVFPMTFPILTTTEGKGTASNNSDGTYNTAVNHLFPANETDTAIECLYLNLNFRSIASLRIVDRDTIDQPEEEDTMERNTTYTDYRRTLSGVWMVWIILLKEVSILIVIVYAIKSGRVLCNSALHETIQNNTEDSNQEEHNAESSKEKVPVKSTRNMLFGKLSCAVITLTIQITIVILLVVYLATARCSIEEGKTLEGNITCTTNPTKR